MWFWVGPTKVAPRSEISPPPIGWLRARPPTRSRASRTITERPAWTSLKAAVRPAKPAPTTTTSALRLEAVAASASAVRPRIAPRPAAAEVPRRRRRLIAWSVIGGVQGVPRTATGETGDTNRVWGSLIPPRHPASMPRMPEAGERVTARELVVLVAGACLLAVVMHWPLVLHLGDNIPKDLGDPLPQSWQVAWDGHALAHQPLDFFQSNQFWPLEDTLAFSDALVGYAPAGLLGSGAEAAVFRYDLLFLFAYALAFAGAYLLARELGLGRGGAAVAGAAFAFAPFRLEQDGHMQVISSGGIPLAFALGLRGYRLRRPAWVVAGWAVAAWQLSVGFTLGLPLAYLLATIWVIAAVVWLRARDAAAPRPGAGDRHRRRRGDLCHRRAPAQPPVRPSGGRAPGGASNARGRGRVLGPAVDPPGRPRREPGLGRRHVAASGWARERPGEDPVPGPRDPRPGDRRALLARLSALVAAGSRGGRGAGLDPRPRFQGERRARVALSGRVRAGPRLAGDQGSGQARDLRFAGACAACRGGSAAGDARRRGAQAVRAGRGQRDRRPAGCGGRDRGSGASLRPVRHPGPAQGPCRCRPPWHRLPRPSSTCRPSEPPTTAATCCGRPTASRRSSTGARA